MDPLSVAAGVAGLVWMAYQAAQEVDRLVTEIKGVPEELSKMTMQIQHIAAALSDFREFFVKRVLAPESVQEADSRGVSKERPRFMPNGKWLENMEKLLTSLIGTIRDLEKILLDIKPKKNPLSRFWKWQSLSPKTEMLRADLDRNVQTLLVMMSTFTSMSDAYLRDELHYLSTQLTTTKVPEAAESEDTMLPLSKRPTATRSYSSMAFLSSFPSLSLFGSDKAKQGASGESEMELTDPPPYEDAANLQLRLTWVAGYYFHGEERFCAVFSLTPADTSFRYSRTSAELQQTFNEMTAQGYRLYRLNVYSSPRGDRRYCQGYRRPVSLVDEVPWYAAWDLDLGTFVAKNMDLTTAGYTCMFINACGFPNGTATFSGVWEKHQTSSAPKAEVLHSMTPNQLNTLYSNYCVNEKTGLDSGYRDESGTCAYEDGSGYVKFATVFLRRASNGEKQSTHTKYLLTRADVHQQIQAQQQNGYSAVTINPFVLTGQESFNCTWRKSSPREMKECKMYVGISKEALDRRIEELNQP